MNRSPFDRDHMTQVVHLSVIIQIVLIVTMALSHVLSNIGLSLLNVEKYRDLEIPEKSQSLLL